MNTKDLEHHGSVLTYKNEGEDCCLGYLMWFDADSGCPSPGAYDANHGLIEGLTKRHADTHNAALDDAMLIGLDDSCEVGQAGTFYWDNIDEKVVTFMGADVSTDVKVQGDRIVFTRKGKTFMGRKQKDADSFNFTRTI